MRKKFSNMFFVFTTFLVVLLAFFNVENVSAAESVKKNNEISEEEFQKFKSEGFYGEDVTLEMLNQPYEVDASLLLEQNTEEFTINASYTPEPGDILITNDTSYGGITGHAGIVTPSGKVLHYPSPKVGITYESVAGWNERYDKTNIWRISDESAAYNAAYWAYSNYWLKNDDAEYSITTNITSLDPTYCSKIVWQAYYYGEGSSFIDTPLTKIVRPYDLPALFADYPDSPDLIQQEFLMW